MSLEASDSALVVIDVQYDFCPGGALAVPDGDAVVPIINRLAGRSRHALATQDWHPSGHESFASSHPGRDEYETIEASYGPQVLWPDHCVQGTAGAALHGELEARRFELILRKGFRRQVDSYSAFFENDRTTSTGLAGCLRDRGIVSIYLCGLATDFCVAWSAIDGRAQGFDVTLIEDACRAIDLDDSLDAARASMSDAGVTVVQSSELLS